MAFIRAVLFSIMLLCLLLFYFVPTIANAAATSPDTEKKSGISLNEIGIGSGYAWGLVNRKADTYSVYPAFARFGFNINSLVCLSGIRSSLQLAVEPQVNIITGPENGVEAGCGIGLRYFRRLAAPLDVFFEASVAPMFLSIDTHEQGAGGFNFLDQFGVGLQYKLSSRSAVFGGYRWRHISHAGLSDRANIGINSNAIVAGLSWFY